MTKEANAITRQCAVDGCTRPRYRRSRLCGPCAARKQRYGDPRARPAPKIAVDLTGSRHGTLTVDHYDRERQAWFCRCDCGRTRYVATGTLNLSHRHTCGHRAAHRADTATYAAAHERLRRGRGRADSYRCAAPGCSNRAAEWAYDHADPEPLTDPRGHAYSLDAAHYRALCHGCHKRFDKRHADTDQLPLWPL